MDFANVLNFFLCLSIIYLVVTLLPVAYSVFLAFSAASLGIKLAEWLMTITRKYILNDKIGSKNKAVLITGCDSGFGNALARRMDKLGYSVYATCLLPEEEGAKELAKECSEKLKILPMDVTNDQSIHDAKETVVRHLGKNVLWAVVNNAGIFHTGEVDWTTLEEMQQIYNVNTVGTLRVTKAFLPLLKKSKGRIINMASIASRVTLPWQVGYCMSKAAVLALTQGLRMELAKWGVKAITIEPYIFPTRMAVLENLFGSIERTFKAAPKDIQEEYGEDYIKRYKKVTTFSRRMLCSRDLSKVIDCLEDAITAKEPLPVYIPGPFMQKVAINCIVTLPSWISEAIGRRLVEFGAKPQAIMSNKRKQ